MLLAELMKRCAERVVLPNEDPSCYVEIVYWGGSEPTFRIKYPKARKNGRIVWGRITGTDLTGLIIRASSSIKE